MNTHQRSPEKIPATPTMSFTPVCRGLMQRTLACGATRSLTSKCIGDSTDQLSLEHRPDSRAEHSTVDASSVQQVLRSAGEPLDHATRDFMEPRFGHDFSQVRVHRDEKSADSARSVNALAYTVGNDIVFGANQYCPQSTEGKKILAHELTHTIQQGSDVRRLPDRLETTSPNDTVEREADAAAESVVKGGLYSPAEGHDAKVARQSPEGASAAEAAPEAELAGKDLPKKTVTVNVTYLKGGSTDIATHLTKANTVFAAASVDVKKGNEKTLDEAASKVILGDDLILDEFANPATPTTEEKALIKENRTAGTITMYYVGSMSKGSIGEAFNPASGQPASFVYASTNTRTWPHELGHILLDDGSHPADADNFMAQTSVASGVEKMTDAQKTTIRASAFVK